MSLCVSRCVLLQVMSDLSDSSALTSLGLISIVSIIADLFILISYCIFPSIRSQTLEFATWLAIGSFGFCACTAFLPFMDSDIVCTLHGILNNYFALISVFTTAVIADKIRLIFLCLDTSPVPSVKATYLDISFVFIFPAILVALPLLTNHYGNPNDQLFCWIKVSSMSKRRNRIGYFWEGS
jgi:hypothetical protein